MAIRPRPRVHLRTVHPQNQQPSPLRLHPPRLALVLSQDIGTSLNHIMRLIRSTSPVAEVVLSSQPCQPHPQPHIPRSTLHRAPLTHLINILPKHGIPRLEIQRLLQQKQQLLLTLRPPRPIPVMLHIPSIQLVNPVPQGRVQLVKVNLVAFGRARRFLD